MLTSVMQNAVRYLFVAVVTMVTMVGASAWADCACFCVDGQLKTLCTEVNEAQNNPSLCPAASSASCPQNADTTGAASHESPTEGAVNCRDVQVYDGILRKYVTAKACDVI